MTGSGQMCSQILSDSKFLLFWMWQIENSNGVLELGEKKGYILSSSFQICLIFRITWADQNTDSLPPSFPEANHLRTNLRWFFWSDTLGTMNLPPLHDWATSLSLFTFMHWRRKWQPTPVFLPGESQGQESLVGCPLWAQSRTRLKWLSSSSSK